MITFVITVVVLTVEITFATIVAYFPVCVCMCVCGERLFFFFIVTATEFFLNFLSSHLPLESLPQNT